jgi:hypothetical protein
MNDIDVRDPAAVTVIIPTYRPDARFIRTLESIRAQTHPAVFVNVSVDPFPGHEVPDLPDMSRLTIIHQPTRLGWVGNTNALLPTIRTPLFLALSHDDTLTPKYVEKCVAALMQKPEAIVAHGAFRNHGARDDHMTTPPITGTRIERLREFIRRRPHMAELGWRGVTRTELVGRGIRLRTRRSDGHLSNVLWALEQLCYGDSVEVPGEYYDRFVEADGLSRQFHQRSLAERSAMLADNAACVLDVAREVGLSAGETEWVFTDWIQWLLELQGNWNVLADEPRSDARTLAEMRPAMARFVANVALSLTATCEARELR